MAIADKISKLKSEREAIVSHLNGVLGVGNSTDKIYDGTVTTAVKSIKKVDGGTPTASKSTVSGNSVTVTPSVTNTTGYVTGSTITGTAVTVSASELVSGTKTITSTAAVGEDVTNYKYARVASGSVGTPTATKGTVTDHQISITPSVTPTTGYITGGTEIKGSAVTVKASDLVSGNNAITATTSTQTNIDVTNYATVSVAPTPSEAKTATLKEVSGTTVSDDITPSSGKLLSKVTVPRIDVETKTITAGTSASTTDATSGKYITSVTVNPTPSESKTATPTAASQTISPSSGKLLSGVTVSAVPATVVSASNVLTGTTVVAKKSSTDNTLVTVDGTMANNGATGTTITTQGGTYNIPAGYTSGGTVTANITASSLTNSIISGTSYEEATGDYAWRTTVDIPAGYHNAQTITKSFSDVFPAPETEGTASQMLLGYQLYDHSGKVITGTMPNNGAVSKTISSQGGTYTIPQGYHDGTGVVTASIGSATITSGSATATISTPSYNSTSGKFEQSASGTVNAPSVGTAGYVSSSVGTKNTNSISGSKTLDVVGTGVTITGDKTKAPTLKRTAKPSGDTWVDAASGSATTTKPTSGVYVQIDADANTGTLTATPKVTSAGYGTTANYGATAGTATVGASKATTAYVPITTTSASVSGKTVSYGTGWITGGSKSVADGDYSASVSSHTVSTTPVVTPSISGNITDITTTTTPSGTNGTDYWTIDPSGSVTTTGKSSAKGKATIGTAGYISTGNKETSSADVIDITPTVASGTNRYLVKASSSATQPTASATAGTASILNQPTASASTSVSGMVTTTTNTGYSVTATASANSGNSTATGGSASTTAGSVTVGVGYNPSSVTKSVEAKSASGTTATSTAVSKSANDTKYIQKGVLSAEVSKNTSGSASMSATGFTKSSTATDYYVTLSTTSGAVKAKAKVGTEGYVKTETNETSDTTVSVSGNGDKIYIPSASPSFNGGGLSVSNSASVTGWAGINATATTTDPGTGMYLTVTSKATPSRGDVKYSSAVAGYVSKAKDTVALSGASGTESTSSTKYYVNSITVPENSNLPIGMSNNVAWDTNTTTLTTGEYRKLDITNNGTRTQTTYKSTSAKAYSDLSVNAPIEDGGALTGNKPIVSNGKWYTSSITPSTSSQTAYGRVVVSAMTNGSASVSASGTATKPTIAKTTTSASGATNVGVATSKTAPTSGYFVSNQATAPATTVTVTPSVTAGYISSITNNGGSVSASTGDVYYTTLATGVLSSSGSVTVSGSKTVSPGTNTISKNTTNTNVSSGTATTTKPSSGYYIAVDASTAQSTDSISVSGTGSSTASVTTSGYVTSSQNASGSVSGSGSASVTIGAKSATTTYIPITSATPSFDGGAISLTGSGATVSGTNVTLGSSNTSGVSIKAIGSTKVTRADVLYNGAVNGYVNKADNAVALSGTTDSSARTWDGTTYYISKVTVPNGKSFSVTGDGHITADNSYAVVDMLDELTSVDATVTGDGDVTVNAYNEHDEQEEISIVVDSYFNMATSPVSWTGPTGTFPK